MLPNVPGNRTDNRLGFIKNIAGGHFSLEIGFCLVGDVFRNSLKPNIDIGLLDILPNITTFVKQANDGFVGDGLGDRVSVNHPAEFRNGIFVLFENRRAREADIAGSRQRSPHLGVDRSIL